MQRPTSDPKSNAFETSSMELEVDLYVEVWVHMGEKFSSSEFMQSNITQHLSDPQYYFQVNGCYVRNKLKVVIFPSRTEDIGQG